MTRLAEWLLKTWGWQFVGEVPPIDKMIIIGAPHSSNWDFVVFLAAISHWGISPRYVGKHTLFRWPFGYFFRKFGGIPVDRSRPGGMVAQVVREFEESDHMILVMAPEGTRRAAPYWKSGFVRVAAAAGVPMVPACLDFPARRVRLGEPIVFTGDENALMEQLRAFYAAGRGKGGQGMGPVRLSEEL